MEAIQKDGDWLINEIMEGSSGNESEEINNGAHTCYGYKNLGDPPECCLALALSTKEELFFCKATHLVSYLIKQHCKQGAKTAESKSKENKVTELRF